LSLIESRLTAQLLAGAWARDPVAIAERLLVIQTQEPRGAARDPCLDERADGRRRRPRSHRAERSLVDQSLAQ
jgi:hypothetical protein